MERIGRYWILGQNIILTMRKIVAGLPISSVEEADVIFLALIALYIARQLCLRGKVAGTYDRTFKSNSIGTRTRALIDILRLFSPTILKNIVFLFLFLQNFAHLNVTQLLIG